MTDAISLDPADREVLTRLLGHLRLKPGDERAAIRTAMESCLGEGGPWGRNPQQSMFDRGSAAVFSALQAGRPAHRKTVTPDVERVAHALHAAFTRNASPRNQPPPVEALPPAERELLYQLAWAALDAQPLTSAGCRQ